jgi:uncharacterized protein HemX
MKRFFIGILIGIILSVGGFLWMKSRGNDSGTEFKTLSQVNKDLTARTELLKQQLRQTDSLLSSQIQITRTTLSQLTEKRERADGQIDSLLKSVARADAARGVILDHYRKELENHTKGM